jgi:hypothetical protein
VINEVLTESFWQAVKDYYRLGNRDYPEIPALKLVGDRYRLSGAQRTILFRGVTPEKKALLRKSKRIRISLSAGLAGKRLDRCLYIDGYNVLFTIMNYLLGKPVFIGNDGFLRDAGGSYGKVENEEKLQQAISLFVSFLGGIPIDAALIYLDRPAPHSETHARVLLEEIKAANITAEVRVVPQVDDVLVRGGGETGVIATSDSGIIDAAACGIYDLARDLLETRYGLEIPVIDPAGLL